MTITFSQKIEDQEQADRGRRITFRFVFHTGEEMSRSFLTVSNYNDVAGLSAMIPIVEQDMIDAECERLISEAEGDGIDVFDAEPWHPETISLANRKKNLVGKALRHIVNQRDIKLARKILYATWHYLKFTSGYTAQQIADYLDISIPQLQKINSRFQFIHDNLSDLDADDSYLEDIE